MRWIISCNARSVVQGRGIWQLKSQGNYSMVTILESYWIASIHIATLSQWSNLWPLTFDLCTPFFWGDLIWMKTRYNNKVLCTILQLIGSLSLFLHVPAWISPACQSFLLSLYCTHLMNYCYVQIAIESWIVFDLKHAMWFGQTLVYNPHSLARFYFSPLHLYSRQVYSSVPLSANLYSHLTKCGEADSILSISFCSDSRKWTVTVVILRLLLPNDLDFSLRTESFFITDLWLCDRRKEHGKESYLHSVTVSEEVIWQPYTHPNMHNRYAQQNNTCYAVV